MGRAPQAFARHGLLLIAALDLAAACSPTAKESRSLQMEAIIRELNEAWNAKDADAIEALFANEAASSRKSWARTG